MIELFTADTPNGKKISIMLEEIQYEYKVTKVNLFKNEQFNPEFKKISPFNKTPVIKDHDNGKTIFESGAILIYLGNKSGKFYDEKNRDQINQWLMAQMGYVGPMLGQHHQFHHYNPGKLKLILSGFHEGALAARACFKLARPNEKYRFEFTTSSKAIKHRLGVKSD